MEAPLVIFTAKLTRAGFPDENGIKRGNPGYTYVDIVAELADGSKNTIAQIYAPNLRVEHDRRGYYLFAVQDEEKFHRGNYYVTSVNWVN